MTGFFGLESSWVPIAHVAAALAAGGAIGLERTLHGRAPGFRTYALVCMGSAMAMVVAVFPGAWLSAGTGSQGDVTRVIQGILTGIGFLGAGVIVKSNKSPTVWKSTARCLITSTRYRASTAMALPNWQSCWRAARKSRAFTFRRVTNEWGSSAMR